MSAAPSLEAANAEFYQAFEALDLAAMDGVWVHNEDVRCVHPGWPLLTGWPAVRHHASHVLGNPEAAEL